MARLILYKLRSPYEMDYAKDGNLTKTEMDVNLLNLKGDIISSVVLDEETNTLIVTKMKDGHKDCAGDIIDSGFKVDLNKLGFVGKLKVEDGKLIGEKSDGTTTEVDLSDLKGGVFTDTDELPVTGINKNTIYRLNQNDRYILYHNPTETDGEYLEIGGGDIEGITNEEIDELIAD